jgi:hypothetical protein
VAALRARKDLRPVFLGARFEHHPYNAPDYQIELGLLGRQLIQTAHPTTSGPLQAVKIYLVDPSVPFDVARGTGLMPIEVQIAPTKRVLRAAIETLLSLPKTKRADGLINALADSQLQVNDVTLVRGKATLALSGQFKVAGVGAEAYAIAQLRATARQFPTVKDVVILVNGCPLPIGESGSGCINLPDGKSCLSNWRQVFAIRQKWTPIKITERSSSIATTTYKRTREQRDRAVWIALGLAPVIPLGLSRFAYALLLPPMRGALGWSFTQAGGMNTANAIGYVIGAATGAWWTKRFSIRMACLGSLIISSLAVLICGTTTNYMLPYHPHHSEQAPAAHAAKSSS